MEGEYAVYRGKIIPGTKGLFPLEEAKCKNLEWLHAEVRLIQIRSKAHLFIFNSEAINHWNKLLRKVVGTDNCHKL